MPSTTPRSKSPLDGAPPREHEQGDVSLMVEPPTQLLEEEHSEPYQELYQEPQQELHQEDDTVRFLPSTSQPHPPPQQQTQIPRADQSAALRVNTLARRSRTRTPDVPKGRANKPDVASSPSTPGHIVPFDWDDFEMRYQKALDEADEHEKELLDEFDHLVKYFNAWAAASSAHDNERAVKRLQTRERHVRLREQTLSQRMRHHSEVVKAFQSALALLSTT